MEMITIDLLKLHKTCLDWPDIQSAQYHCKLNIMNWAIIYFMINSNWMLLISEAICYPKYSWYILLNTNEINGNIMHMKICLEIKGIKSIRCKFCLLGWNRHHRFSYSSALLDVLKSNLRYTFGCSYNKWNGVL